MRIISGLARGIRLSAPEGRDVRPTEDRVKESIFGTLGSMDGKTVVDLFSGTGALGLEALSRGAASVFFVEQNKKHVAFIENNLNLVLKAMGNQAGETRIICSSAQNTPELLSSLAGQVSIILADPPYSENPETYGARKLVADKKLADWAGANCILALEHTSSNILPWHPLSTWDLLREKTFGIRAVSFARQICSENKQYVIKI